MSLKIMGGRFKGLEVKTPKNFEQSLRPTASRVRESLFNILFQKIENRRVLDLFAGVGSLGFEALSRGAAEVTFIEKDQTHLSLIYENIERLKVQRESSVIKGVLPKALSLLRDSFDLVFIDPPYEKGLVELVLNDAHFFKHVHSESIIIVEQSKHSDILSPERFELTREHRIGDTCLCFFKPRF